MLHLSILLLVGHVSFGQKDSVSNYRHIVALAYFGDQLSHPGGMAGYGYRAIVSPHRHHALVTGCYLGGYHFPNNSNGVFLLPYLGYEYRAKKGFQFDFQLGAGYLHTFADGAVYEFQNGSFQKVIDKGVSRSMLPYLSTGLGYWRNLPHTPLQITPFIRTGFYGYYPINQLWSLRLHWSIGTSLSF